MKRFFAVFALCVAFVSLAMPTFAHDLGFRSWDTAFCLEGPNRVPTLRCIPVVFENVVRAAIIFSGAVAVAYIIFAGAKFVASGGDAKQVEGARKTLTYAIIGLVVILVSFLIIHLVSHTTGVGCINEFGLDIC